MAFVFMKWRENVEVSKEGMGWGAFAETLEASIRHHVDGVYPLMVQAAREEAEKNIQRETIERLIRDYPSADAGDNREFARQDSSFDVQGWLRSKLPPT